MGDLERGGRGRKRRGALGYSYSRISLFFYFFLLFFCCVLVCSFLFFLFSIFFSYYLFIRFFSLFYYFLSSQFFYLYFMTVISFIIISVIGVRARERFPLVCSEAVISVQYQSVLSFCTLFLRLLTFSLLFTQPSLQETSPIYISDHHI